MKDATKAGLALDPLHACFNPRAREGRDLETWQVLVQVALVSTHAPVKDATTLEPQQPQRREVSTHAPVKDATRLAASVPMVMIEFQPTRP